MIDTPRITIDNIDHIRILVCHLIYSLGCPLTKNQLIEITSLEQAVNYFDLIEALDTIDRLCAVTEYDGETLYSNTKLGVRAAKEFCDMLPVSVREKMFEEAVRVYTRDAIKTDSLLSVRYAVNPNGTSTVGISVLDDETGGQKYYLNINTDTSEQAESIKKKVKSNPERFIKYLDDYFSEK